MRGLFLFILLSLSFALQAGRPYLTTVPYSLISINDITMAENKVCQIQARISAKALQNARIGVTLETQLATWDTFIKSTETSSFSETDLSRLRELIVIAWDISITFPDTSPNTYGDQVYNICATIKLNNNSVKF